MIHASDINPDIRGDLNMICGKGRYLPAPIRASRIIINLSPEDYLDITDPSAALPPAHVTAAAMKKDAR